MALTKITGGVVSAGSDYQVGVITATKFVGDGSSLTGLADPSTLTFGNATKVEAVSSGAIVTGILTATSFSGDGSTLTGVGGLGDGLGSANNLNYLFTSPELLELTANTTISATEAQGKVVFTASESIKVATGVVVTVAAGTTVKTDVLKIYDDNVGTALINIAEDTTPQLGGNLDLNNRNITGTGDINISGSFYGDGSNITGITTSQIAGYVGSGSSITDGTNSLNCDGVKIAMTGHLIPTTNDLWDIGSAEYKIRDLYLSNNSLHTESGKSMSFNDGNLMWGGDDVIMLQDLKDMMATATSFEDFKNAIMGL